MRRNLDVKPVTSAGWEKWWEKSAWECWWGRLMVRRPFLFVIVLQHRFVVWAAVEHAEDRNLLVGHGEAITARLL